jgi:hypothetical protein
MRYEKRLEVLVQRTGLCPVHMPPPVVRPLPHDVERIDARTRRAPDALGTPRALYGPTARNVRQDLICTIPVLEKTSCPLIVRWSNFRD